MKKSIAKNYLFNLSYQILLMILPIITTPYISRTLQAKGVGTYNYTFSITSVCLIIASLGTNMYGQREIAYSQNNKRRVSYVFIEVFIIRLISTLVILPIYYIGARLYTNYSIVLITMSIYIYANLFDISWLFQGLEDFKKTAVRSIGIKVVGVVLIFLFVKRPDDLILYTVILSCTQLIGNLILWVYLPGIITRIDFSKINLKHHIMPVLILFLPTASMYVYTFINKIFLGILSNAEQVGYFSQSEKIVKLMMTVLTSMGTVLLPHTAALVKNNNISEIETRLYSSLKYILFLGYPMTFGMYLVANRFVPWFLGSEYNDSIVIMQILSPLIIIIGIASVSGQAILVPFQKQKIYTISILVGAGVNVVCNILLIPAFQAVGASISTIIAESTVTMIQILAVKKVLNFNLKLVLYNSRKHFIASAVMGLILIILNCFLGKQSIYLLTILLTGCIIYILLLVVMKDEYLNGLLKKKSKLLYQTKK